MTKGGFYGIIATTQTEQKTQLCYVVARISRFPRLANLQACKLEIPNVCGITATTQTEQKTQLCYVVACVCNIIGVGKIGESR